MSVADLFSVKNISKLVLFNLNYVSIIYLNLQSELHRGTLIIFFAFAYFTRTVKLLSEGSRILIDFILPFIYSKIIENPKYFFGD